MYYGREKDFRSYESALTIIYNGPPTEGQVYYQEKIGVYTDAYIVKLKSKEMSKELGLYLTSAMNQSIHNHQKKNIHVDIKQYGQAELKMMTYYFQSKQVMTENQSLTRIECITQMVMFQIGSIWKNT